MSAIGAPEDDLLAAFKNVKKIDGEGAIALVQAAEAAGVQHFVMVSESRRPIREPAAACCGWIYMATSILSCSRGLHGCAGIFAGHGEVWMAVRYIAMS